LSFAEHDREFQFEVRYNACEQAGRQAAGEGSRSGEIVKRTCMRGGIKKKIIS